MALETQTGSTGNGPNFGQKNWGDCVADQGICSLHKNHSSNLVSSVARPQSKARLEGTVKRHKCHWRSQHSYSLISGPAIPSGGFLYEIQECQEMSLRMPNRINLDVFLELKNNNNIWRFIMDIRICSEL